MSSLGVTQPAPADIVGAVREAAATAPKRMVGGGFSLAKAGLGEMVLAPILGLYLGYAVVRLPEVFPQMNIPHLPMVLMLGFLAMLGMAIPSDAWSVIWNHSRPLRLVMGLVALAVGTAPVGIWPSESFLFIREKYFISVVIFLCCLVFLRDRKCLRMAIAIYVLCVGAVSYNVVHTYDPNAIIYNEDGEPIDPAIVAARPELRRITVGVSLDSNDFGAIICTTFPLALWLSVGNLRRRIFWSGIAVLLVMAVVPTQSRGAELGMIAAGVVLVSAGARGWRRWLSFALIAACVAVFVMMATGIGAGGRFADFSEDDYNLTNEGRWFFWKQGFIWMLKRPWGYGIMNYPTYFGMLNGPERAAHSSWVQYGMELGVAGIVTFVLLCVALVGGLRHYRKRAIALGATHPEARNEAILSGHMLALMAGVLVTGSFLSNAYYPLMYMALGLAGATLLGAPLPPEEPVPVMDTPPASSGNRPRGTGKHRLRTFPGQAPAG